MKKLLAILLAVVMTCTLVFSVYAADETLNATGNADEDVNVTVKVEVTETKYHVDITWDDLTFVYKTTKGEWNPSTHEYDDVDSGWENDTATVEIVNHSNAGIAISKTYVANDATAGKGVVATVGELTKATLPSAEGKATDSADLKSSFTVSVAGQTPADTETQETFKVGTITITISAN